MYDFRYQWVQKEICNLRAEVTLKLLTVNHQCLSQSQWRKICIYKRKWITSLIVVTFEQSWFNWTLHWNDSVLLQGVLLIQPISSVVFQLHTIRMAEEIDWSDYTFILNAQYFASVNDPLFDIEKVAIHSSYTHHISLFSSSNELLEIV